MRALPLLAALLISSACVTKPRLDGPPAAVAAAPPGFDSSVRLFAMDRRALQQRAESNAARIAAAATDGSIDILALSGGGAGGAYGAGVLVGLSEAHARPQYEIVTGVSTGALIAPAAFVGADYDSLLREGYASGASEDLMVSLGIGALFGVSAFQGRPLRDLVNRFVTDDLIAEVARQSQSGRMLLVATTNLDREEMVIWDMGAIARQGGPHSRELFRNVLVASASVPGVFPPVMIEVRDGDHIYQEMHVDGGASTPFFIAPDIALALDFAPEALRGANVFVISNTQLAGPPHTTRFNTVSIASRSFSAVMTHTSRAVLAQADAFAHRNGMDFHFTVIPRDYPYAGSLAFDRNEMSALFDYGRRCAAERRAWVNAEQALARAEQAGDATSVAGGSQTACPLLNGSGQ